MYAICTGPKKDNSDPICSPWNNGDIKQVIEVANSQSLVWLQHDYPKMKTLVNIFVLSLYQFL